MDYEFGIGSAAQFVQVHADALAVRIDAEGNDAIEEPEEQIDQRQDKAEQGGDADELGDELAGQRCESPAASNPQKPLAA